MTSFLFLLLLISSTVLCLELNEKSNDYIRSLAVVNNLRECAILGEFHGTRLPALSNYRTTSCPAVNWVVDTEYTAFWQNLRKRDHFRDAQQLADWSKGVAIFVTSDKNPDFSTSSSVAEANLLLPLCPLFSDSLQRNVMQCIRLGGGKALDCIRTEVEGELPNGIEKEIILSAVHLLSVSVLVRKSNWDTIRENELDCLRSLHRRALDCVRVWDRYVTLSKILYLTFLLHARHLIAFLSNNTRHLLIISCMQVELGRLIQAEFPSKIVKEVMRKQCVNTSINCVGEDSKRGIRMISEVRVFSVQRSRKILNAFANIFVKGSTLFMSVDEAVGKNNQACGNIVEMIMQWITSRDFDMKENPTILYSGK